jgi:hypothetical protein
VAIISRPSTGLHRHNHVDRKDGAMADDAADDQRDARDLGRFVGSWDVDFDLPGMPTVRGRTTFDWLLGHRFLVQQAGADHPEAPDGHMIIAADLRRSSGYVQHYFDSRGVVRTYEMDVDGPDWTLIRTTPDFTPLDFAQRWVGRFSDDGETITGRWETSPDGVAWQLDFHLTYRRARGEK